jgi:flavin-binding protein dodecin
MSDHIYKSVELTGSSPDGIESAVENAIARASDTIRNIRWFEISQLRGQVRDGKVAHWQVTMKLGFTLDDSD